MAAEKADITEPQKGEETSAEVKTEPATTETNAQGEEFKKPLPPPKKEEQKPAADATDEQSKSEDSTLILSAEEEAEIAAQTNEDAVKTTPAKTTGKTKKENQRNVWVSNISRSTKATDLKKLFSEKFKVDTAKIVTNGKSFFGYICLESPEMAQASVKEMNGAELIGRNVTVSLMRPDLRGSRGSLTADARRNRDSRRDSRPANGVKKSGTADGEKTGENGEKKEGDGAEGGKDTDSAEKKEETAEEKLKDLQRKLQKSNRLINDLKADLTRVNIELQNNRRRLTDANRRMDTEKEKKIAMRRDIDSMEVQLKSERRRFAQELEQMEKKRKMDEIRYQDDRSLLNKELDECRKLREYLQRKIDDIGISRHNRSPPRRSGPAGRGMQDKMGGGRGRMHPDNRGGRSTPPPPKINNRRSRERSPFKGGKKPRMDDESFGNNHYSSGPSSFQSGPKPLINYPQGSSGGPPRDNNMYGSTAYPAPQRYGGGYNSGSYQMGSTAPLMSRPMGYPTGGPRKY